MLDRMARVFNTHVLRINVQNSEEKQEMGNLFINSYVMWKIRRFIDKQQNII